MPLPLKVKSAAPKRVDPLGALAPTDKYAPKAARALFSPPPVNPSAPLGVPPAGDEGPDADTDEQPDTSAPAAAGAPAPVAAVNQTPVAPAAVRPQTATTSAAPQSESSNPLTGSTNSVPAGQSTPIAPHYAGQGDMRRGFSNPTSAQLYGSYVKNLTGIKPAKPITGLRRVRAVA